jgi:hypothetical protein
MGRYQLGMVYYNATATTMQWKVPPTVLVGTTSGTYVIGVAFDANADGSV